MSKAGQEYPPPVTTAKAAAMAVLAALSLATASLASAVEEIPPGDRLEKRLVLVPEKQWDRALLEYTAVLGLSGANYMINRDSHVKDSQYAFTWKDQKRRLLSLEGVRFDSNDFQTNWTHATAGAVYYTIGRANHLSVGESLLLAIGENLLWECQVEYREVVSINDTIMNLFGGPSIGEPWFQMAEYLAHRPGMASRSLSLIHPLVGVEALLDGHKRNGTAFGTMPPGCGVSILIGARRVASSLGSSDGGDYATVELRSRIVRLPGFAEQGSSSGAISKPYSTELRVNLGTSEGKVKETEFSSRGVFLGHYEYRLDDGPRGYTWSIGLGSAFTMLRKAKVSTGEDLNGEQTRRFSDKFAIAHLAGPVFEAMLFGRAFHLGVTAEAYPDFGLINAYALNEYTRDHEISGMKTTMRLNGYYYGYGGTAMARIEASSGPFLLGVSASAHRFESIEGGDRFQSDITDDAHATDSWLRCRGLLSVAVPRTPLHLEAGVEWSRRRGEIRDVVATGSETRYSLAISCAL